MPILVAFGAFLFSLILMDNTDEYRERQIAKECRGWLYARQIGNGDLASHHRDSVSVLLQEAGKGRANPELACEDQLTE